jgi:hypothetical protein
MRTHEIYRNLSDWLLSKTPSEIEERYEALGMRRAKQGVPFSELLYVASFEGLPTGVALGNFLLALGVRIAEHNS